jgi:hypothetical protein
MKIIEKDPYTDFIVVDDKVIAIIDYDVNQHQTVGQLTSSKKVVRAAIERELA